MLRIEEPGHPDQRGANSRAGEHQRTGPRFGVKMMTSKPRTSAANNSSRCRRFGCEITAPVSALSSTWAWISTPGMARDTGVVLMSLSPTAEVPISTSLPAILSGGTRLSSTSTAGDVDRGILAGIVHPELAVGVGRDLQSP